MAKHLVISCFRRRIESTRVVGGDEEAGCPQVGHVPTTAKARAINCSNWKVHGFFDGLGATHCCHQVGVRVRHSIGRVIATSTSRPSVNFPTVADISTSMASKVFASPYSCQASSFSSAVLTGETHVELSERDMWYSEPSNPRKAGAQTLAPPLNIAGETLVVYEQHCSLSGRRGLCSLFPLYANVMSRL